MGPNSEILYKVAGHIESNPEEFDMNFWPTCIAGIVCSMYDIELLQNSVGGLCCKDEKVQSIHKVARDILGLTNGQAMKLFCVNYWPESHQKKWLKNEKSKADPKKRHNALRNQASVAVDLLRSTAR